MKDHLCDQFQDQVDEVLIRHRSVLDIITKLQEASARTTRAFAKAVTTCGCIQVTASKPVVTDDMTVEDYRTALSNHVQGELCDHCREVLDQELGQLLFYTTALASAVGLGFHDLIRNELKRVATLGVFNCT